MTHRHIEAATPRRISWGMGLLLVGLTIQLGVVLPATVVFLLLPVGGRLAAPAMVGGFFAAWIALIAVLRTGWRRGWWA